MPEKHASRAVLDEAIEAYYRELCAVARRHAPAAAQDVVHDLYIRLTGRSGAALDSSGSVRAVLMRACINLGIDRFRRERLERRLFAGLEQEALQIAAETPDADAFVDRHRRIAALHAAIMEMSVQRRRVFLASCIGGLPADSIAERMGISRNMVDRHLRKAYLHCLTRVEDML